MDRLADSPTKNRKLISGTAAAMYGGAVLDEVLTSVLPGDAGLSPALVAIAAAVVAGLLLLGPHLPRAALAAVGPIGVLLIAQALAGATRPGDGAVLYAWPVLWMSFFYGRRGAIAIIASVGVAHAVALASMPGPDADLVRWIVVMVPLSTVAAIVAAASERSERLAAQLGAEARVDALTGLLNRRGYQERAEVELARARRDGARLAVAAFDIDHFKHINDTWGHEVGDRVLARVGAVLRRQAREIDAVARVGGEEFLVLIAGGDLAHAHALAERVRRDLQRGEEGLPPVLVSAGIDAAAAPPGVGGLHRGADAALYAAKRAGRNRTVSAAELIGAGAGTGTTASGALA